MEEGRQEEGKAGTVQLRALRKAGSMLSAVVGDGKSSSCDRDSLRREGMAALCTPGPSKPPPRARLGRWCWEWRGFVFGVPSALLGAELHVIAIATV